MHLSELRQHNFPRVLRSESCMVATQELSPAQPRSAPLSLAQPRSAHPIHSLSKWTIALVSGSVESHCPLPTPTSFTFQILFPCFLLCKKPQGIPHTHNISSTVNPQVSRSRASFYSHIYPPGWVTLEGSHFLSIYYVSSFVKSLTIVFLLQNNPEK